MTISRIGALAVLAGLFTTSTALAQNSSGSGPASAENVVLEPAAIEPTPERIDALSIPDGFEIEVFAENLGNARMIAISEIGNVYVTRRTEEDLVLLGDGDGEVGATAQTVLELPNIHGVHIAGDQIYLATINEIYVTTLNDDGTLGELRMIVDDLPDAGQHPNRTLAIGPDGMLYVSVGSTCNACDEPDDEQAALLRMTTEGGEREVFASGLRNTIGFGWHPETDELWGVDHGSDARGSERPPEELNLIAQGQDYGWPWCYNAREVDELISGVPEGYESKEAFCAETEVPVLTYTAHAAPLQLAFYTADAFPDEHRGDAFQVMRGSWNANPPVGYEVVRIDFEDGAPVSFEPFITGFLVEEGEGFGQIGRLAGLAVTPEGALLFSDDENGVVYRVRYTGE